MVKQIAKMPIKRGLKDPNQGELDLLVDRQVETDGIGMGVLRDGTPFLNQRGLARLCGVENRYIGIISTEWTAPVKSERTKSVQRILMERGALPPTAAHETFFGQKRVLAYPDEVCMAVLEYYAFEANLAGQPKAMESFRRLASFGLRQFIYTQTGYESERDDDVWRIFKDRVSLTYDAVPDGYFSVFKELASLIVTLGLQGLHISESFVPDISVGKAWAQYWKTANCSDDFGHRSTYAHNYPEYFPQAASNPQMANCYPEEALGRFRKWFREEYVGEGKFERYLSSKVSDWSLPNGYVERVMIALNKEG